MAHRLKTTTAPLCVASSGRDGQQRSDVHSSAISDWEVLQQDNRSWIHTHWNHPITIV